MYLNIVQNSRYYNSYKETKNKLCYLHKLNLNNKLMQINLNIKVKLKVNLLIVITLSIYK